MKYKRIIIILILSVILFNISAVCASDAGIDLTQEMNDNNEIATTDNSQTFTQLNKDINVSGDTFEITHDYTFDYEIDNGPVLIEKSDFTINGNYHILDGNNQSGIFNITGNNIIINNLFFINANSTSIGAIYSSGQITLNNVTFINNNAEFGGAIYSTGQVTLNNVTFIKNNASQGGAIWNSNGTVNSNNSIFVDNQAERGSSIYSSKGQLYVSNSYFTSTLSNNTYGQIFATKSYVDINNVDFVNITSKYAPALYFEDSANSIINSRFINLTANISVGAIAVRDSGDSYIKDCKFINTRSIKNAGALMVDYGKTDNTASIVNCLFDNDFSPIGGAFIQLGGYLLLNDSNFTNNKATESGGAVYLSYTDSVIYNCIFDSNIVVDLQNRYPYGGAIYSDCNELIINSSKFINNSAFRGNAIYSCDSYYDIFDSTFKDNTNAIYTDFDEDYCDLTDNDYNDDSVIINQSYDYKTFIDSPALELEVVNNTINVTTIPSRLDLREWGWVTPVKNQGRMGSCWTFGTISAVESALLKLYGAEFDLSEDNLFHNMLRYFPYGCTSRTEGGFIILATSYLLAWMGPALEEEDIYDEVGKLSPFLPPGNDVIHVQDMIIIPNDEIPDGTKTKSAIMQYGALAVSYYSKTDSSLGYYNSNTSAHYVNVSRSPTHVVSVIGWDDNFSADNFLITPPGDGAWIVKNSWGSNWGDEGIVYISYYDKSFSPGGKTDDNNIGIILDNTVPYNKNYQHDFVWLGKFVDMNKLMHDDGNITYANQFEAADNDLIAAVGTYFESSDVNYTVDIYVNDELKLTQEGISPFFGYHTIKLNEYVPIKKGDIFKAAITSNTMPVSTSSSSRVHYSENRSFFYYDDEWKDLYALEEAIACLKVYTIADDTNSSDDTNDTNDTNDTDDDVPDDTPDNIPDDNKNIPIPDFKPIPSKKISRNYNSNTVNHVYTLYRASDMKIICQSNVINVKALIDLFKFNLTNGHLKVYIDGILVFEGDIDDDLSKVIFEIIEKFLGKHEITAEFTNSNGKKLTFNETVIIE